LAALVAARSVGVQRVETNSLGSNRGFDHLELAQSYDKVSDPQFTHGRDLIGLLAFRPQDHILDIGCGTGRLAAFAAKGLGPSGRIVGLDPASSRIEVAKRIRDERLDFRAGRAEDLSAFTPAQFDVAYMNSVLNWLEDKPRALAEARRVLKPGGRFGIATTIRDQPNELWGIVRQARDLASGLPPEEAETRAEQREAKRYLKVDEIRELLHRAGLVLRREQRRTYLSAFPGVPEVIEFMRATTDDQGIPWDSRDYVERLRVALDRVIAQVLPETRRRDEIQLERHVLLVAANKPPR
jgi:arsenite methyltransferase